jgi:hypothetical protein
VQNPTDKTAGLHGSTQSADVSTAAIISAGLLGNLREVICWTNVRTPGVDLVSGLRDFRNRGCQLLAGPMLALGLEHPATVYGTGTNVTGSEFPEGMAVRYQFPAHGDRAGVVLTWYDGEWAPPYESVDGVELSACGTLYLGRHGQLLSDEMTGRRVLLRDNESPRELPATDRATGTAAWQCSAHRKCVNAAVVAGIASFRVRTSLDWDGAALCARNSPEANALIRESLS